MRWVFEERSIRFLGLASVSLLSSSIFLFLGLTQFQKQNDWVRHTQEALQRSERLLSLVKDAETAQRGYLLTGEEYYLHPYRAATQSLQPELQRLQQQIQDNPQQHQQIRRLALLVNEKLEDLKQKIELQRSRGPAAALSLVKTDRGQQLMDEIRQVTQEFQTEENRVLQWRSNRTEQSAHILTFVLVLCSLLPFSLILTASFLLYRDKLKRQRVELELRAAKAELENRVELRTAELSQANRELQDSETKFRQLAENIQEVFWIIDWPTQEHIYISPAYERVWGRNRERIYTNTHEWLLAVHPNDRPHVDQALQNKILDGTFDEEYRILQPDGSIRWIRDRAFPIPGASGEVVRVAGLAEDITERRLAEEALQTYANEVSDLYNHAPCGYHSLNADGFFVQINDTELSWLGYTREEILGKLHFTDIATSTSRQTFEANFSQFQQRGWVKDLEFELTRADGTTLPVLLNATAVKDAEGNFIVSRSTLFDMTDLKQTEEALRRSEAKFRSLCESSPIGIFMLDPQGHCIYTNPRCQEICGVNFEELSGNRWLPTIHAADQAEVMAQHPTTRSDVQSHVYPETRYLHPDGTIRYGRSQIAPVWTTDGELTGYVGTLEDITQSRAIEQMKNEFISVVSHELRTPLASIRGSLGLLAAGVLKNKPETAQKMLEIAAIDTERLVRLVNDILDLERLESNRMTLHCEWCSVSDLMQRSIASLKPLAQKSDVTLECTSLDAQVWADPDRIIQTLVNLLSNAIKFSDSGASVQLSATLLSDMGEGMSTQKPADPAIAPALPYFLFQVKDQGRGIPADQLEKIFGRFQQVDASDSRQKGGTGLGLAICRSIVQQHGGQIWAESLLGQGSIFYFTLPIQARNSSSTS